ncbi:YdcH family protein [Ferrimonas lipolytica]|uniref:YdcH family protein n=1 Tax=Ferrimonas lipolytica TaxID=2724191 RepID=A0A6H1UFA9_9GAMM|nr:YdcH family protein [Ferrimonas lipolytica]QIZ77787.1 YdcH family protein [Ferrimonas lipolytica]
MIIEDHSLVNEFPKDKTLIQELNMVDNQFHQLFNEYHELDREVHRIEEGIEVSEDAHLESLKVRRLSLKDSLFGAIQQAKLKLN